MSAASSSPGPLLAGGRELLAFADAVLSGRPDDTGSVLETELGRPAGGLVVFAATDGRVVESGRLTDLEPGLVIDALIGYGLGGAPSGVFAE